MPANTPRLETERLVLRRFTPADVEPLFSLMRDREVNTFLPWFPLETEADAARYLEEHYLYYYRRPSGCRYAVCLRENDSPIGYLHVDDGESHDLGYALARPSWGRGYMTEAAAAVVERLRADGLPFLTATHDADNPKSGAVMERIGMTYRYSYEELWQPKNRLVIFRMYQMDLNGTWPTYRAYWDCWPRHWV